MAGRKLPKCECLFVRREKGLLLSVYVDDVKLAGKKQNLHPMWKNYSTKKSIWENQHLSWIMYTWACTQREFEISKDIVDNYRTMFESRISAGGIEKLPFPRNLRISSWSYDMAGHAKKCVERYCELANKTTQQLYKVSVKSIPLTTENWLRKQYKYSMKNDKSNRTSMRQTTSTTSTMTRT